MCPKLIPNEGIGMNAHNHSKLGAAEGFSPLPSAASTMLCGECDGKGEAEYMGLCEDRYHWRTCHECQGSGKVEAACETCGGKLINNWCSACDDEGLCFVERVSPTQVML